MTHPLLTQPPRPQTLGRHLLIDFHGCARPVLNDVPYIEQNMKKAAQDCGATIVNSLFHRFSPFGASGVVVIQESHLAIHTWPEYGYAAVDLFTCGDSIDQDIAYQVLQQTLQPKHVAVANISRGQLTPTPVDPDASDQDISAQVLPLTMQSGQWFTEQDQQTALSFRYQGDRLFYQKSPFQDIEIFDTLKYGRMLILDQKVMCSEQDECAYHEMLVHLPMFIQPQIKTVLVIGGGDGGTVRELLKHQQIESITMVEIDEAVIKAARTHLPTLSTCLNDPKLNLIIGDAVEYIAECPPKTYDLVLIDSSDPVGPAAGLVTTDFYQQVSDCLTDTGMMVTQSGSPKYDAVAFQETYQAQRKVYGQDAVYCYLVFIPTYPSGMWSFSLATKSGVTPTSPMDSEAVAQFVATQQLDYYNGAVHRAAFSLPNFVTRLLAN